MGQGNSIIQAAAKGEVHELRLQVQKYPQSINQCDQENGWTALHVASWYGYDAIVRELLARHADVHMADKDGRTPLHYAAMRGHVDITQALLRSGADAYKRDKFSKSPLEHAAEQNHYTVKLLLHNAPRVAPPSPVATATGAKQPAPYGQMLYGSGGVRDSGGMPIPPPSHPLQGGTNRSSETPLYPATVYGTPPNASDPMAALYPDQPAYVAGAHAAPYPEVFGNPDFGDQLATPIAPPRTNLADSAPGVPPGGLLPWQHLGASPYGLPVAAPTPHYPAIQSPSSGSSDPYGRNSPTLPPIPLPPSAPPLYSPPPYPTTTPLDNALAARDPLAHAEPSLDYNRPIATPFDMGYPSTAGTAADRPYADPVGGAYPNAAPNLGGGYPNAAPNLGGGYHNAGPHMAGHDVVRADHGWIDYAPEHARPADGFVDHWPPAPSALPPPAALSAPSALSGEAPGSGPLQPPGPALHGPGPVHAPPAVAPPGEDDDDWGRLDNSDWGGEAEISLQAPTSPAPSPAPTPAIALAAQLERINVAPPRDAVGLSPRAPGREAVGPSPRASGRDAMGPSPRAPGRDAMGPSPRAAARDAVGRSPRALGGGAVGLSPRAMGGGTVGLSPRAEASSLTPWAASTGIPEAPPAPGAYMVPADGLPTIVSNKAPPPSRQLESSGSGPAPKGRKYTYEQLRAATSNFSPSRKIGAGGYGPVYRGLLDGIDVAIKCMDTSDDAMQGLREFQKEVDILSSIHHPHIVLLIGSCPERGMLVYELMPNGSLDDHLFDPDKPPLLWHERLRITHQLVAGLLFLHSNEPPIIHMDIKPGNVLLDGNLVAKLGDVGLARLVPPTNRPGHSVQDTRLVGTLAYMDPEYMRTGNFSPKSDVYSVGIVMLQLLTGKDSAGMVVQVEEAVQRADRDLMPFNAVIDRRAGRWPPTEALSFAKLALPMISYTRAGRPDLKLDVLPALRQLVQQASMYSPPPVSPHSSPSQPPLSTAAPTAPPLMPSLGPSRLANLNSANLPQMFVCPITQDVMEDPVFATDGYTYERVAIQGWLQNHSTSPMTNMLLEHKILTPNLALRSSIKEWMQKNTPKH